jgi:hypothetical protein
MGEDNMERRKAHGILRRHLKEKGIEEFTPIAISHEDGSVEFQLFDPDCTFFVREDGTVEEK